MINPKHINEIITETLHRMGISEPAAASILIKGTFAVESNLTDLFSGTDNDTILYGFMMLPKNEALSVLRDHIAVSPTARKRVLNATGIEIDPLSDFNELLDEMKYNISFMVAVTYCYYDMKGADPVNSNVSGLAKIYETYYHSWFDHGAGDFIEKYFEIFT